MANWKERQSMSRLKASGDDPITTGEYVAYEVEITEDWSLIDPQISRESSENNLHWASFFAEILRLVKAVHERRSTPG
jgi:hypothetical protein